MSAMSELGKLKDKGMRADGRDNKAAHFFLLPWLVGLVAITIGPMLMSLYLSFTDYNLLQPPEWTDLENFIRMFSDARLHNSLGVTFTYVLVGVPLQLSVALLIALVLDKGLRGVPSRTSSAATPQTSCSSAPRPKRPRNPSSMNFPPHSGSRND